MTRQTLGEEMGLEVTVCPLQFQIRASSYNTVIAHVIAIPLHPQGGT
jgi:hypothetical protein